MAAVLIISRYIMELFNTIRSQLFITKMNCLISTRYIDMMLGTQFFIFECTMLFETLVSVLDLLLITTVVT